MNRTPTKEIPRLRAKIKKLWQLGYSTPEMAKELGFADHTTIIYHLRAIGVEKKKVEPSRVLPSKKHQGGDGRVYGRTYRQLCQDYGVKVYKGDMLGWE
jgi:hypothetical protein